MDTNVSARRLAQRGQEPPLRCLWRIKRGDFKEVSQWPSPERGRALADTTRAQPRRRRGSLAALSAATRTRAPKRATGTFFSLRSCPVRASARIIPKRNTIRKDGVSFWSGRRGSNSLPRPWQGRALPDELRPQNGASGRGRTGDTRIFSPLLYQLSYRGKWRPRRGSNPRPPA